MSDNNIILPENLSIEVLDGGVKVFQDNNLYKFTSDAVLLSRFARSKAGDVVADICSGSGIVGFNFYAINKNIDSVTFFEMQEKLFELSKKSIAENKFTNFYAVNTKVQNIDNVYNGKFSLVLCNPPYEKVGTGIMRENYELAVCRQEIEINLTDIFEAANKLLKFGGRFCMVHRADRLAELFYIAKCKKLEPKRLSFVKPCENKEPYLVLVEYVKGGKTGLKIEQSIVNR